MKKILLLIAFLFAASNISAQSFAVGPQVGYLNIKGSNEGTYQYGLSARFNFLFLGIEGTASYAPKTFSSTIKSTGYPLSVSGMVYVLPFIYGCAGLDWSTEKYTIDLPGYDSQTVTSTTSGYHLGVGIQISLGSLVLTGDARYMFFNKEQISNTELDNNYYLLAIGVLFKL